MADEGIAPHRLNAIGSGLFFICIGVVLLAHFGWGVGLLGVGALMLGGQAVRTLMGLKFVTLWSEVGVLFVLGGVWDLLSFRVGLAPILCLVAGLFLVVSALAVNPKESTQS
jgi:hypothetical protein